MLIISHEKEWDNRPFWIPKILTFKTRLSTKSLLWKSVLFAWKKIYHFHINGPTLGLTLKQRLEVTWKCPIYMQLKLTCIACRTFFMQAALVKSLSCVLRCACLLSSDAVAGVVHRTLLAHTLSRVAVSWAFWRRHSS